MVHSFFQKIASAEEKKEPAWLAVVIGAEGSTPARIGMKMLVCSDGSSHGTIGGGEIERRATERIRKEKPSQAARWRFDLGFPLGGAEKTGMICGGYLEVLVDPLFTGNPLYIFGGGHCGMALSGMAALCGFQVTVVDDRAEWASPEKHPQARECVCVPFTEIAARVPFSPELFLVLMTHGHAHDEIVLRQCFGREYRYLGMLGSVRKVRTLLDGLLRENADPERLRGLYSPVGFDIGSCTPAEIAVSILAQMIAVRNGRQAIPFSSNPLL